jgi:hypothetical protein
MAGLTKIDEIQTIIFDLVSRTRIKIVCLEFENHKSTPHEEHGVDSTHFARHDKLNR